MGMEWPPKLPNVYYQDDAVCLVHADCRDILPLLSDKSIELVLTDPPYGTNLDKYDLPIGSEVWSEVRRLAGKLVMVMGYASVLFDVAKHFSDLKLIGYIVWYKPNEPVVSPGLTRTHQDIAIWGRSITQLRADKVREPYRYSTDLEKFFGAGSSDSFGQRLVGPKSLNGRRCTDLWEINVPYHGFNAHLRLHPHQKPNELVNRLILLGSDAGDIVLDPFLGSGTTAMAAKKLGRKCIGIEISEHYCEVAAKRCSQMVLPLEVEKEQAMALPMAGL